MLRTLPAILVLTFATLTFAEEPKPKSADAKPPEKNTEKKVEEKKPAVAKPEEKKPAEVTERPARDEFLVLPLRIYRLRASEFPAAHTKLEVSDIERIVKKVNRVWSHAGITFALESIRESEADFASFAQSRARAEEFAARIAEREKKEAKPAEKKEDKPDDKKPEEKKSDEKKPEAKPAEKDPAQVEKEKEAAARAALLAERNSRLFQALIPGDTKMFDGFRVYYIQDFDVNGIYYGRREAMVKATANLRQVPGGIDEPLPRVTSHELGHGLGLPHRQDRTNLMQSGTTGTTLNEDEVKKTRELAEKVPGLLRYRDLASLIEKEKDADRKAQLTRWKEAVEEAAK